MNNFIRVQLIFSAIIAIAFGAGARTWHEDKYTNPSFCSTTVIQPDDYSGKVVSTVVRKLPAKNSNGKAVLYVHGFNDYFFQTEMADMFVENGYAFYAVDLRKYGRSVLPGQKMFQVRNMREYFPDIDSTFSIIREDGFCDVVLIGHSTGGLTTSLYMATIQPQQVKALILNSPFLAWNLSPELAHFGVPAVSTVGAIIPGVKVKQSGGTAYAESLLKDYHGEWNYDTNLKLMKSPDVDAGWINAINDAQLTLHAKLYPIGVPVLLMHSDKSVNGSDWNMQHNIADGVLNVNDISHWGRQLGPVTEATVKNGLHDLVLSSRPVREAVYSTMIGWLNTHLW